MPKHETIIELFRNNPNFFPSQAPDSLKGNFVINAQEGRNVPNEAVDLIAGGPAGRQQEIASQRAPQEQRGAWDRFRRLLQSDIVRDPEHGIRVMHPDDVQEREQEVRPLIEEGVLGEPKGFIGRMLSGQPDVYDWRQDYIPGAPAGTNLMRILSGAVREGVAPRLEEMRSTIEDPTGERARERPSAEDIGPGADVATDRPTRRGTTVGTGADVAAMLLEGAEGAVEPSPETVETPGMPEPVSPGLTTRANEMLANPEVQDFLATMGMAFTPPDSGLDVMGGMVLDQNEARRVQNVTEKMLAGEELTEDDLTGISTEGLQMAENAVQQHTQLDIQQQRADIEQQRVDMQQEAFDYEQAQQRFEMLTEDVPSDVRKDLYDQAVAQFFPYYSETLGDDFQEIRDLLAQISAGESANFGDIVQGRLHDKAPEVGRALMEYVMMAGELSRAGMQTTAIPYRLAQQNAIERLVAGESAEQILGGMSAQGTLQVPEATTGEEQGETPITAEQAKSLPVGTTFTHTSGQRYRKTEKGAIQIN